MMNEILIQIKEIAVSALTLTIVGTVLAGWNFLKKFVSAKIAQVEAETQDDRVKKVLECIKDICDTVSASFDPIAENLKKASEDGKLTKEEIDDIKIDARNEAYEIIMNTLGNDLLTKLGFSELAVEDLIADEIEASLQKRKLLKACK